MHITNVIKQYSIIIQKVRRIHCQSSEFAKSLNDSYRSKSSDREFRRHTYCTIIMEPLTHVAPIPLCNRMIPIINGRRTTALPTVASSSIRIESMIIVIIKPVVECQGSKQVLHFSVLSFHLCFLRHTIPLLACIMSK